MRRLIVLGLVVVVVVALAAPVYADRAGKNNAKGPPNKGQQTIQLYDIDSGLTSPTGNYRWLDVADNPYDEAYRDSYNHTQATVEVAYETKKNILRGTLTATNLKPNFAYQLKLVGTPDTTSNERVGLAGRWWQETWNGSEWANGQNLNNKGDGSSPNPNDLVYLATRDIEDPSNPTGKEHRYTGYLIFDYFITDVDGNTFLNFQPDSSYHVLWKTSQRARTGNNGPTKTSTVTQEVRIFGEWERLPVGGVYLDYGNYDCQMIIAEESFHGSGGALAGNWTAATGGSISFKLKASGGKGKH